MRRLCLGATAALAILVSGLAPVPATAVSPGSYDVFDSVTLNDLDGSGDEIPYTSHQLRTFQTPTFDTAAFTVQDGESGTTDNHNGCLLGPDQAVFAGRTAWVRFNPGVNGTVEVLASTPGYDSVLIVRSADELPWGSALLSDLDGHPSNCADNAKGAGSEGIGDWPVRADEVLYVQVGGKCPGGPDTCSGPGVPGGPTTIRLTITPEPDRDGDDVPDSVDDCADLPGVPAEPPFNGCPEGPDPFDPDLGAEVVIRSKDGNVDTTRSVHVDLWLNWPKGAQRAMASNGDGEFKEIPLQRVVPWTLRASGDRDNRSVDVRFTGPGIPQAADDDDIILDPVAPRIPRSLLIPGRKGWYTGLRLTDRGTGVKATRLLDAKGRTLARRTLCTALACKDRTQARFTLPEGDVPAFAVVTDVAGNNRRVRLSAKPQCSYWVPEKKVWIKGKCFRPGDACRPPVKQKYNWGQSPVTCTKKYVVRRR